MSSTVSAGRISLQCPMPNGNAHLRECLVPHVRGYELVGPSYYPYYPGNQDIFSTLHFYPAIHPTSTLHSAPKFLFHSEKLKKMKNSSMVRTAQCEQHCSSLLCTPRRHLCSPVLRPRLAPHVPLARGVAPTQRICTAAFVQTCGALSSCDVTELTACVPALGAD